MRRGELSQPIPPAFVDREREKRPLWGVTVQPALARPSLLSDARHGDVGTVSGKKLDEGLNDCRAVAFGVAPALRARLVQARHLLPHARLWQNRE